MARATAPRAPRRARRWSCSATSVAPLACSTTRSPGGPGWLRGGRGGVRGIAPARRGGDAPSHPPSAHIPTPAWLAARLPRVLALALRVLLQLVQLCVLMTVRLPRPDVVLLQTPPCVPSFTVCRVVSALRGARFIIDWHNFAYTLMALQLGERHPLVAIARRYEAFAGRFADAHICVTDAMRDWLAGEWDIRGAVTLRDRPPAFFARTSLEDAHELFARLGPALDACPTARPDDPGSRRRGDRGATGNPARRRRDHTVHRASNDRAARVEGILQRRAHAHVGASRRLGRATGAFGVEHELDPRGGFRHLARRAETIRRPRARGRASTASNPPRPGRDRHR